MRRPIWLPLAAALCFCGSAMAAAPVPLKDFAKLAQYTSVKISPDGAYIAVKVPEEDRTSLVVIRLADRKVTAVLRLGSEDHIHEFWWKANNRLLATKATQDGSIAQPLLTGELVAINADGSGYKYLFGYRGGSTSSRVRGNSGLHYSSLDIIDPLRDDPRYALVAVNNWQEGELGRAKAEMINVYTGELRVVAVSPFSGNQQVEFLADSQGQVRYATGVDDAYQSQSYRFDPETRQWVKLASDALGKNRVYPLGFSADDRSILLQHSPAGRPYCLAEQNIETGDLKDLICDPVSSVTGVLKSFDDKDIVAGFFEPGKPDYRFIRSDTTEQKLLHELAKSFADQFIMPISYSADGKHVVLKVFSDRNSGDFYLLDRNTKKADYLFSEREWIDPAQMAEVRPVEWKARDGTLLHGYLTLPPGVEPKKLPMIVHPHGGPFGIRDEWEWDPDVQVLASRGYAVLQVNFRGSGGYGPAFRKQGDRQWGGVMIDDITDGAKWAIGAGYADASRMCIYGASYGGYASMMSAVREPDLYRCVIAYAGVYDLNQWKHDADVGESSLGRTYIGNYIGATPEELKQQSPLTYIDKLEAAVMIVHGKEDRRVPLSQAKTLVSALDDRHYPYETLYMPGEGHGFYKEQNRLQLYEKLLAFLGRHIGTGAALAASSSSKEVGEPAVANPRYAMSAADPQTGSRLKKDELAAYVLPLDKSYGELTPAEAQQVRDLYTDLPANCEPPFPLHGMKPLIENMVKAQSALGEDGRLMASVLIDSNGEAKSLSVYRSPSPEMTKLASYILMKENYKPAKCDGKPVQMEMPFRANFK